VGLKAWPSLSLPDVAGVRCSGWWPKRTLIPIPSVLLLGSILIYCEHMRLRLVVEYDSETMRWAAFFPELPGCASAGDTEDEAIQNAKEALELWFEPTPVDLPAGAKVLEVALT
jgi:predicted RNase H-like HicB family nuclease